MGHVRLKRIPASRKWTQVVELLANGAPLAEVAGASAEAADSALEWARHDPVLAHSLWLLTQLPLAARAPDFGAATHALGVSIGSSPTLLELVAGLSDAIDRATAGARNRTDLGEMARKAAAESLAAIVGADLPALFGPTPQDLRLALGKLAAPDRFAKLARDFFARLTRHHLDYYLSRSLSEHVGPEKPIRTVADHAAFNAALEQHCREAARIVEAFAGGWFSRTIFTGGMCRAKMLGAAQLKLDDQTALNGGGECHLIHLSS
jgi:hypothetical protein